MNTWALPVAASAFWAGLLAWSDRPWWLPAWASCVVGLAALVAAWIAAPRVPGTSPLEVARLVTPEPPVTAAVASPRSTGGAPHASAAIAVAGLLALGLGWAGVHAAWLDGSLMARLSPRRVTVVGTLHTDPEAGPFGWFATLDVTRVGWSGGAATLRTSVWLSADGEAPAMVRGDQVSAEGVIRRPDDPGFAEAL